MKVLICAGQKTDAVVGALSRKFDNNGDAIQGARYCEEIHEKFMLGTTYDRVVIFETAITHDEEPNIDVCRDRIEELVSNISVRGTDETLVFIVESEELADVILSETFEISDREAVIQMAGPYKVTFIARAMITSVDELASEIGYKPSNNEPELEGEEDTDSDEAELFEESDEAERDNESTGSDIDDIFSELGLGESEPSDDKDSLSDLFGVDESGSELDNDGTDELFGGDSSDNEDTEKEELATEEEGNDLYGSLEVDEEEQEDIYSEHEDINENNEEADDKTDLNVEDANNEYEDSDSSYEEDAGLYDEDSADESLYTESEVDELKDIRNNKIEYADGRTGIVGDLRFCTKCGEKLTASEARKVYMTGRCPKCLGVLLKTDSHKEEEVDQSLYKDSVDNGEYEDDIEGVEVSNQLKSVMKLISKKGYTICFTGCDGAGVSTTAFNAANIISAMGYSVLLVDLDTYNRAQGYLSYRVYKGTGVSGTNLIEAVNTDKDIMSSVVVVRSGFHALTIGIAEDLSRPEDILKEDRLSKFITEGKAKYDFIVVDTKLHELSRFLKPVAYMMDDIVAVVDDSKHGIIKYMLEMTNIEDEDVQYSLFSRQKVILNRYRGTKEILGYKVRKTSELMKTLDKVVSGITGCELDIFFRDIPIVFTVPFIPEMEECWFSKKQISDTRKGKELFRDLVASILMKENK